MSKLFFVCLLLSVSIYSVLCTSEVGELKCLVCTRLVEEMLRNVSKVDAKRTINVGGFRLDDKGNYVEKTVPYPRSEIYLTEVMESICNKMEDYVRARFKKDGRLTVISLMSEEGKMNPIMSEVDVVQDSDLNKSLKYYCEEILDENDEAIVQEFGKEQEDVISKICADAAQLCEEETIRTSRLTVDEL